MNRILCELLRVNKHNRKTDNSEYYSVTVLIENRVSVMFFKDAALFNELSKFDRLADICLIGDIKVKDDTSFLFVPQSVEI